MAQHRMLAKSRDKGMRMEGHPGGRSGRAKQARGRRQPLTGFLQAPEPLEAQFECRQHRAKVQRSTVSLKSSRTDPERVEQEARKNRLWGRLG